MMKKIISMARVVLFLSVALPVFAFALVSPVAQMQGEANRMVSQLAANKSRLSNLNVIRNIVNSTLLPNVDVDRMAASVVGQSWRSATPAQKAEFQKQFSYLVTTTYASALASYNDDKVYFQPIRGDYADRQTMRISSVIVRKTGQRIPVSYDVVRAGDHWKVYDFSIENISMVQSYRSQFASTLAQGGMPALLNRLRAHNQSV